MTMERSAYVLMPERLESPLLRLQHSASSALLRGEKLSPGDRTEAIRFESIHAVIDQMATAAMVNGEPTVFSSEVAGFNLTGTSVLHHELLDGVAIPEVITEWIRAGRVVVELRLPHYPGPTVAGGEAGRGPHPPATRWMSSGKTRAVAERERFEFLLSAALDGSQGDMGTIRPSEVSNQVLTECLRQNVEAHDVMKRTDLRVTYRDGSEGPKFPLRALLMNVGVPNGWRVLRFTLMSVRHVEMDVIVDGAWLRNSKVSRPRPMGLTDEIVFETSLRQLRRLDTSIPTLICMYQTGLPPAIVGFYRAVACHLIKHPGSIAVVPYYYQGENDFIPGTPWRAK